MATHILIDRGDGTATYVRSRTETAKEDPLTEDEILINELHSKGEKLKEENKRSDAIIISLLKERFEKTDFSISKKAKYIEFPIRTSMGLLHYKTEVEKFI